MLMYSYRIFSMFGEGVFTAFDSITTLKDLRWKKMFTTSYYNEEMDKCLPKSNVTYLWQSVIFTEFIHKGMILCVTAPAKP